MSFYFKIENMDNAAFEDDPGAEVARIMQEAAASLEGRGFDRPFAVPLRDINGNKVGVMGYE